MRRGVGIGAALLVGAAVLGTAGCCCGGGGHGARHGWQSSPRVAPATAAAPTGAPTLGRELEDLKAAYQRGAISQEEYELARRRLIGQGEPAYPQGVR